jgi:4-amino-4-deoxychorismate lyase
MPIRSLAVLGRGLVPVDTPIARADDAGLTRGDGVFETIHVRAGRPWLLDEHLERMARSAAMLELRLPAADTLRALGEEALAGWPGGDEAALRLACTRGPDTVPPGDPTVYATVLEVGPAQRRQRQDGVAVLTATLGIDAGLRGTAPWLLGGAKTLSYAVNLAALRWAAKGGADDVILLASGGEVLEAPTATVVWAVGDLLCTVPADTGILAGITAAYLLDHAAELDRKAEYRRATVEDLLAADGVWLCSSLRGAAQVNSIDGTVLAASRPAAAQLNDLLGHPTEPPR